MKTLTLFSTLMVLAALAGGADAAGIAPTHISLPNGPGSIEGLGRNFVPSLASGTAAYGVDIAVPPGAGGFGPKLGLDYDSGTGASELGLGWHIGGVPRIRRRTENGLPRFDASDSFELVGLGIPCDLLEMSPGIYRPQEESGAFVRVQRSADGSRWEARDKTGVTYRFGGPSFVESERGNVATFLLRESIDLHGHKVSYAWDVAGGRALLESVTWNDYGESFRNIVQFNYEDRPDPHVLFSAGIRQELTRRLKTIEVTHGAALVRRYELTYAPGIHSLLSKVELVGSDGTSRLPALSLVYTEPSFAGDGQITTMTNPPGRSPADPNVEIADLDGDGLPDLLVTQAGQFRSYLNHDGVSWQAPMDWSAGSSPSVALGTTGVQLADLDGDGALDLVVKSGLDAFRYFPGRNATSLAPAVPIATVPNFTFEDPDVKLGDFDGDRRTDVAITTAAGLAIAYNLGGNDWTEPALVGVVDPRQPLRFSDGGHTQLCDVNGDRVLDLCYLRPGALTYWLGRGRGRFEPAQSATGVPAWDPSSPWELHDLDGDGWVDLVHVGVDGVDYALATTAGEFSSPRRVAGTPEKGPTSVVRFADMNGSGTTDIVWIDVSGSPDRAWRYLELFPKGRAGLLQRIDNGLGKLTTVTYAPAALDAAAARTVGSPWATRMNIGMPVIRRVEVDDSLGDPKLATEYTYRDGTYDPRERTFAGFAGGIERQVGDTFTPTLLTDSTFDVGLTHRMLRGAVLTAEQRDEHGYIFFRSTIGYTARPFGTSLDGRPIDYAYKSSESIDTIEGADVSKARTTLNEWEQDEYGNVTAERRWGEIVGSDKLAGGDEAITVRTYANNERDWILGKVATEEVQDGQGRRVALKRNYYDGQAFEGLALGAVVRGDLRRVESWIDGEHFADEQRADHDKHGNVIAMIDARGAKSEFDYDADSQPFVIAERHFDRSGTTLEWHAPEYDGRFGGLRRIVDPNGNESRFDYDPFGRPVAIVKPGDSLERPTQHFSYALAAPLSVITVEQREVSGADGVVVSKTYVDGLSRERGTFAEGSNAGQWVLSGFVSFDARGKTSFTAYPSFQSTLELPKATGLEGTYQYRDATGREISKKHGNDGAATHIVYSPLVREEWDENDMDPKSSHYATPTTFRLDGLGRLRTVIEKVRDAQGGGPAMDRQIISGTYTYDPLGKLVGLTDAAQHSRTYVYDGRSRRIRLEDPNAGVWKFQYTDGNDLAYQFDPAGNVVHYTYDDLGRTVEEWHQKAGESTESRVVAYHYDAPSPDHPELGNVSGDLAWVEDPAGTVFLGYTPRGIISDKIRRWKDGNEHSVWTEFDAGDRPLKRGFPDGTYLPFSYDSRGRLSSLGPVATEIHWTPDGELDNVRLGNGILDRRHYDGRHQLERLEAMAGTTVIRDLKLARDAAALVQDVLDLRPGVPAEHDLTIHCTLDDRNRLVRATDASGSTAWSYDDMGNIASVSSGHDIPGLNVTNRFGENGAGPDQMTHHGAEALEYDAAGRLTKDGERRLTWDAKGRLIRVERGDIVEEYTYAYDGARAIKTTVHAGTPDVTRYIDKDVEERGGRLLRYTFLGDERIARLDPLDGEATPASGAGPTVVSPRRPSPWGRVALVSIVALLLAVFARHAALLRARRAIVRGVLRALVDAAMLRPAVATFLIVAML
ncbi:MAG TPA: FG-GAP-like repeat-containing protein, partial [Polyangiaceae bacterium]